MPEGDTIHNTARALDAALAGRTLVRLETPRTRAASGPAAGTTLVDVEARGKHVLIRFEDGSVLHTHLGLHGSWHLYRPGERWMRAAHGARVVLEVEGAVAVCFAPSLVEIRRGAASERHPALEALGPDLCRPDPDLDEALRRLARFAPPGTQIGVALLDQRVAAGIGNVYKSEVLFACGIDPFTPVEHLSVDDRRRVLRTASELLRRNLGGGRRATVPGGLAVYGRTRRPCRRCGTPIRSRRQGEQARMSYWCPRCQPRPRDDAAADANRARTQDGGRTVPGPR